ncbi:conserved hypothetical protein [anaerobic digester metagenome]|uniref:DUF4387 domain-containing protein n=1 Tax=anaerobic digester metagenome TaxID=1263854 RepID=A0A485M601_9ZZZZ
MKRKKLVDLAKTIRSKNAGPDKVTFDIIFAERKDYELVKRSHAISKEKIAGLFNITVDNISDFVYFDPANAVKFTFYRSMPSGNPGDGDIFACQQYPPLYDIEIPIG